MIPWSECKPLKITINGITMDKIDYHNIMSNLNCIEPEFLDDNVKDKYYEIVEIWINKGYLNNDNQKKLNRIRQIHDK